MDLAQLCVNPIVLRCDAASPLTTQIELEWYLDKSAKTPAFTMHCRKDQQQCHILVTTGPNIPYAYFGPDGAYVIKSDDQVLFFPNVKYKLQCNSESFADFSISSEYAESIIDVNLFQQCHLFLSTKMDCFYCPINDRFIITRPNGSFAVIDVSRQLSRAVFPIVRLCVHNPSPFRVNLCSIQRIDPSFGDLTAWDEMFRQRAGTISQTQLSTDAIAEYFPINKPNRFKEILLAYSNSGFGQEWQKHFLNADRVSQEQFQSNLEALKQAFQDKSDTTEKLLQGLYDRLRDKVYEQVILSRTGGISPLVAGWEADYARSLFNQTYGADVRFQVQDILANVVQSEGVPNTCRLQAADCLGLVGMQDREALLGQLKEKNQEDQELLAILASVAVRSRIATEEDQHLLNAIIRDKEKQKNLRLICLEAAFLGDYQPDLDPDARDLLFRGDFDDWYIRRAVLAAPQSSAGCRLVLHGCAKGWPSCPVNTVLPLARWSALNKVVAWGSVLDTTETIFADEYRSVEEREIANSLQSAARQHVYGDSFEKATKDMLLRSIWIARDLTEAQNRDKELPQ